MNKNLKNFSFILFIFVVSLIFFETFQKNAKQVETISYSTFLSIVEGKKENLKLKSTQEKPLIIEREYISGYYYDSKNASKEVAFKTYIAYTDLNLISYLKENGVPHFKGQPKKENFFVRYFLPIFPYLLLLGILWFFMFRQIRNSGNKVFSFGKTRAKINVDFKNKKTFKDVAGADEAKEELEEVVEFLKSPEKFKNIGARTPKGVLLVGSPGTGKTLLARAVSGEAKVPFISISGSEFVEMFVGVGASRVRDLFSQAKKSAPCIIFIDEIDAVGRLRGSGLGGGHDEREQTLNQLLVEMDGFEENTGIIIIAATNRVDVLDPALLRPGRFDRQVMVSVPDLKGRVQILKIHTAEIPLDNSVDLEVIARGTPGFTGADLENLANESAIIAVKNKKKKVFQKNLEDARDKVLMGPERKSFHISSEEKEIIAYHEAGHAIVGSFLKHGEPVHKVTIIPRGGALGLTQQLPKDEKHLRSKNYWLDAISILMGGRIAEEIKFQDITTGASNDIERATEIANKMVTEWGMTKNLGPIRYSIGGGGNPFVGKDYTKKSEHSEEYTKMVDQEVQSIIRKCYETAHQLLKKNIQKLDKLADALMDHETIDAEELSSILGLDKKKSTTSKKKTAKKQQTKTTTKEKTQEKPDIVHTKETLLNT